MRARWLFLAALLLGFAPTALAQQWYSMQTAHLISYSEGNDRGARDAALRGEQLIAVFGELFHRTNLTFSTPLRLLASSSVNGALSQTLVRTPAANFVIVAPSGPNLLPPAARSIATLTLEDNYPRAQPWFDSGIASYLAGVRFTDDQMELGVPPADIVLAELFCHAPANGFRWPSCLR